MHFTSATSCHISFCQRTRSTIDFHSDFWMTGFAASDSQACTHWCESQPNGGLACSSHNYTTAEQ